MAFPGDEDCLFLNVAAPAGATKLPVVVWIHGGGYGFGDGAQDLTELINDNGKRFIGVAMNYRLGAFGFLASQEVKNSGVVNAGILDQALAIAWVKSFICQFGGDPSKVTIAGQSAGGGSVMYHDIAVNGGLGSLLFEKSIAQSPYLPYQPNFNAALPTSRYYAFSAAAGCPSSGSVLSCLRGKSSADLQAASFAVTLSGVYGTWGFFPVTDGVYIKNLPSQQLTAKNVNGKKLLVGFNANEGPLFVPGNITTQADLLVWLAQQFPNLTPTQLNLVLAANPNSALTNPAAPMFETNGLNTGGFNAVNTGPTANGQQQRGNNIYAEAVFACPAYWLAEAYSGSSTKSSYLYQFSVPVAMHGADIEATFGPDVGRLPGDFTTAWRKAWGNFIVSGNPSITNVEANGAGSAAPTAPHPLSAWPTFDANNAKLANFNTTGVPAVGVTVGNAITVANANSWEAYRGDRCYFYRNLGPAIPA
ncbi:Alpha/Beta hydrolase protein [Podospora australis]|uniref:Carboxylic ester hydrolase n=1 Tax=Podospora australis TaxID=1536484 RepID=A0AAN6WUS3_9PEZI|nr:Alpha/Beta hydrolase protein [Podospora australis]